MAGVYVAALLIPQTRSFFQVPPPDAGMIATSLVASGLSIAALWLCGFTLRTGGAQAPA